MGKDTKITVIIVLFYLFNGVLTYTNQNFFIVPVFISNWLLATASLLYLVLSIRSIYSLLFAAFLTHFISEIFWPIIPEIPITLFQKISFSFLIIAPFILYINIFWRFKFLNSKQKITWTLHLILFLLSLLPIFIDHTAVLSLFFASAQALIGIIMLMNHFIENELDAWKKRMILLMILIVYFDVVNYIFLTSLGHH